MYKQQANIQRGKNCVYTKMLFKRCFFRSEIMERTFVLARHLLTQVTRRTFVTETLKWPC